MAHDYHIPKNARPLERLRILVEEYEEKGEEATATRERMGRYIGLAVLVMGAVASIPWFDGAKDVWESPVFWWCAPGAIGALVAAVVMDYAALNGIVYYRRHLEQSISSAFDTDEMEVLRFERGFGKRFYSLSSGDPAFRIILVTLVLAILAIYVGTVWLSFRNLQVKAGHRSGFELAAFLVVWAGWGVTLGYAAYRAARHMKPLFQAAMGLPVTPMAPPVVLQRLKPWTRLVIARPLEVVMKSMFFWGAFGVGTLYVGGVGKDVVLSAVAAWVCLELFVSQAKYVLNDVFDANADLTILDTRSNPFSNLGVGERRLLAGAAVMKACAGSVLFYLMLKTQVVVAIAMLLLVFLQKVYDSVKNHLPTPAVKKWLTAFRAHNEQRRAVERRAFVETVDLRQTTLPSEPTADDREWRLRTTGLAFLLGVGYAVRVGIPLQLIRSFSEHRTLLILYLAWSALLGTAFIMGYWSWEGAFRALRPARFADDSGAEDRDISAQEDEAYVEAVIRSKAHQLWLYRELESKVAKRSGWKLRSEGLNRPIASWELMWALLLLLGPVLGACSVVTFDGWRASWSIGVGMAMVGVVLLYVIPAIPHSLAKVKSLSLCLLALSVVAALTQFVGRDPLIARHAPGVFAVLPSIAAVGLVYLPTFLALLFAVHYTAGPWKEFDQRYQLAGIREGLTRSLNTLTSRFDRAFLGTAR